ncbi:MAG: ATP-binding protein [Candidatus Omnitrophica bacterium]|nr:ATP-binding protein [Candidatus Omnitrophota bacterium]
MAGTEDYIEIEKKPGGLEYISDFIQERSLGIKLGFKKTWELMLVVDEVCSNILANSDGEGFLKIAWRNNDTYVRIEIIDRGEPFNPLSPPPDEDEMLSLGAMGTYMIEKMVDKIEYHRIKDINKVCIIKSRKRNNHKNIKINNKGNEINGKRVSSNPDSP